jgi:two-component SAPR family response regulator
VPKATDTESAWDAVVRVYGFPVVENSDGDRATFVKSRSLEVLAWLGMNTDRPRRSAVRTAIWDIEITDSTFSTILSDIRRGLNKLDAPSVRSQWIPPTFNDYINLGNRLTTDFDLLSQAFHAFQEDNRNAPALMNQLSRIRDVPFAGTDYVWADLDGTTTRMIVVAVESALSLARWAHVQGHTQACLAAVKGGLRVFPGCEELLDIQKSFLSSRLLSR